MAGGEATEAATPKRLQRARSEGNIAVSREVAGVAGLAAATLLLAAAGPAIGSVGQGSLGVLLAAPNGTEVSTALRAACWAGAAVAAPLILSVTLANVVATLLQTGLVLDRNALIPNIARLSPTRGFKRIVGKSALVETVKSTAKVAVLGYVLFEALSKSIPLLRDAAVWNAEQLASRISNQTLSIALHLLGAQAAIACADIAWVRFHHAQQLRMTKDDVRQEAKESDGNPHVKQRIRQMRIGRARKRMLAAVPKATVVVTNPSHYAVALAYDRENAGAPRVVAKGVDEVATRIRQVAHDNRIPMVANPPLARALFLVEVDAEIPAEHFKIVAEIITYVWQLTNAMPRR